MKARHYFVTAESSDGIASTLPVLAESPGAARYRFWEEINWMFLDWSFGDFLREMRISVALAPDAKAWTEAWTRTEEPDHERIGP